jgi:hypothetical protein
MAPDVHVAAAIIVVEDWNASDIHYSGILCATACTDKYPSSHQTVMSSHLVFSPDQLCTDHAGFRAGQPARLSYRTDLGFYHLAALLPVMHVPSLHLETIQIYFSRHSLLR